MKLHRYNTFIGKKTNEKVNNSFDSNILITENLDKSKKLLKERELIFRAASELGYISKDMEYEMKVGKLKTIKYEDFTPEQQDKIRLKLREIKLSPNDLKSIESDRDFLKLRKLLDKNIGYLYTFTYMYYIENTPYEEIEDMYNKLIEYKDLLSNMVNLPHIGKNFDANFIDTTIPNEKEHRSNSEILVEALEGLKGYRAIKRVTDALTPALKQAYKTASEVDRDGIAEIAKAFDELPESKKDTIWKSFFGKMILDMYPYKQDGSVNPTYQKYVWSSKLKEFESMPNPIRQLVISARSVLASAAHEGYSEKMEKIEEVNDKLGILGADIVYNNNSIVILDIKSYNANKMLNAGSNHCIVNYSSQWETYIGDYNKQYYIYNFNLPISNDLYTIGVTIKPDGTWSSGACQSKGNSYVGDSFLRKLKEWQKEYGIKDDLFSYLRPMSNKEIEKKKIAAEAEKRIIEKGISIEELRKCVTQDGANINKLDGKALMNAVDENDFEKVKVCFELGALPNIKKGSESPIGKAQNLEMIKLLIEMGAEMVPDVFKNISNDPKALEYCLKAGLDPNFSNSLAFRIVIKGTWKNPIDLGIAYEDSFKILLKYGGDKMNISNKNMVLKTVIEFGRSDLLTYLEENGYMDGHKNDDWDEVYTWLSHSRRLPEDLKQRTLNFITNKRS